MNGKAVGGRIGTPIRLNTLSDRREKNVSPSSFGGQFMRRSAAHWSGGLVRHWTINAAGRADRTDTAGRVYMVCRVFKLYRVYREYRMYRMYRAYR